MSVSCTLCFCVPYILFFCFTLYGAQKKNNAKQLYSGNFEYDEFGNKIDGEYLVLYYELEETTEKDLQEAHWKWMGEFVKYWEKKWENEDSYEYFTVILYTDRSFSDETERTILGDVPVFASALLVMAIYLAVILGKWNCVGLQVYIACLSVEFFIPNM